MAIFKSAAKQLAKQVTKGKAKKKPSGRKQKLTKKPIKASKKPAVKRRRANVEDFYNVEFDLKARGMTPAQREKLAKEMAFDDRYAKVVRTKDARGKLPKSTDPGIARRSKPKTDPKNLSTLKEAAKKAKASKPKKATGKKSQPTKLQKLQREYDGLLPTVKRAERKKGNNSKFAPVFKARGMTPMKKGGSLKAVDKSKNPGLAKLPTPVRNKMGYAQSGGKVGKVIKANMSGDNLVRSCYD